MSDDVKLPRGFEDLRRQVMQERYAIDELVGASPRRVVFGGHEVNGGRAVLVTVLRPISPHDQPTVDRFERRVAACGRVRHPVVLGPTDHGELIDGKLYLVTERPPGEPLDRVCREQPQGRLSWVEARPLSIALAQGLGAAHARKVVHGALRPGCCWVDRPDLQEPTLRVIDFGVNTNPSEAEGDQASSRTTVVGHDAVFMAPEAAGAMLGDERADVYLMGLVAWFMLVGRAPFEGTNPFQLMAMHMSSPVPAMGSIGVEVPRAVEALLLRMLAKEPDARPGSMAEVEQALLELDDEGRVVGTPRSMEPVVGRGRKGRARVRQARQAQLLGDGGARSREDAVQRLEGGAAPSGRGRRLPGQEIVDPRASVPRREVARPVMTPTPVPPPAPVMAPTPVVTTPPPTRVLVSRSPVEPAPAPAPAPPATASAEGEGTAFLLRSEMAELHWKGGQGSSGVEATTKLRPPGPEVEATTMLRPQDVMAQVGPASVATLPRSTPSSSRPRGSEVEATTMLRPQDIVAHVDPPPVATLPSSTSVSSPAPAPGTVLLTKQQIRALRAGFMAGPPTPGSVPSAVAQPVATPVIPGATQQVSPDQIRAQQGGALSGELHVPGSSRSPSSVTPQVEDDEEATQHLPRGRRDSTPDRSPAAYEETQMLSPDALATLRQSVARPGSGPKKG